ncbi:unnamed protein product [Symbiodinium sp. CCMP2456]|nr:unnamed protein product [Symbiodinium sp. CCMP2456]
MRPLQRTSPEVEVRLQLLWALCQAQNGLCQDQDLLHQAATVQEEVSRQCELLRQELLHVEAELQAVRHPTGPPSPRSREDDSEDDPELRQARQDHDELERALHQAELRLREVQMQPEQDGDSADHPEDTGFTAPEQENAEAIVAEIRSRRRSEQDAAEAQRLRHDELLQKLQLLEARGRDDRWALREELTEACVHAEVLHSEISAERKAREATLERLREEEVYLVGQVSEVQEEADHVSRSSYWSVHSESICSDWSEVARARAALEPFDISTPRGQASLTPSSTQSESPGRASLLSELRGSRRERTRASLAGYRPLQQGEASADPGNPEQVSTAPGQSKARPRGERRRSSLAAFRSVNRLGQAKAGNLQASAAPGSAQRLSVIGEEEICATAARKELHGTLQETPPEPGKQRETSVLKESRSPSLAQSRGSEDVTAASCRGVLEWTLCQQDGVAARSAERSSPQWAGPSLFQVEQLATGRKVFRLSQRLASPVSEELSIPLLAIAAVREDKEDPLGLVFVVRYKAQSELMQLASEFRFTFELRCDERKPFLLGLLALPGLAWKLRLSGTDAPMRFRVLGGCLVHMLTRFSIVLFDTPTADEEEQWRPHFSTVKSVETARVGKQPALQAAENWYYKAEDFGEPKVGAWGGSCRCPNGEVYQVGDNFDGCESLACVGGEEGECEDVDREERRGMKVRCDTPPPPPPSTPPPGQHSREATRFLSWNVYYANDLLGRAGEVAEAILEVDPEIVSLQELWNEWDEILAELNQRSSGEIWEFARGGGAESKWDGDIVFRRDLWMLEDSGMHAFEDRGISWAVLHRRRDKTGVVVLGTHPWCCTNDEPILRTVQNDILEVIQEQRARYPQYPVAVLGDMNANFFAGSQFLMREGTRRARGRDWSILPYTFKDSYNINDNDPDASTGFGVKIDFVYFEKTPLPMGQVVDSKIWRGCDKAGSDHCAVSGDIILTPRGTTGVPSTTTAGGPTSQTSTTTTTTRLSTQLSCADFGTWPDIDEVTCGNCTALVLADPYGGRCQTFCSSFGHVCVAAAEEVSEGCEVQEQKSCDEQISGTSDMLCTCVLPTEPAWRSLGGPSNRVCRGANSKDNSAKYYQVVSADTLEDCQSLCSFTAGCKGVEYSARGKRCEVWTRPEGIGATAASTGFVCLEKAAADAKPLPLSFRPVDGGEGRACRGADGRNQPEFYRVRKASTLELCQGLCALTEDCMGIEWSGPRPLPSIVRNTRACLCLCGKQCLQILTSLRMSLCGATSAAVTLTHCSSSVFGTSHGDLSSWLGREFTGETPEGWVSGRIHRGVTLPPCP